MSSVVQVFHEKTKAFLPSMPTSLSSSSSRGHSLPVSLSTNAATADSGSAADPHQGGQLLRRRLSSLSLKFQLAPRSGSGAGALPFSATSWSSAFRRSKSLSSMGEYAGSSIRKWWDWGWSWILSRKPVFAQDLEMNEEETKVLGTHSRGSWRHVMYKVRSQVRKVTMGLGSNSSDKVGLPQTYRYDSSNYSKNFDN